MNGTERRNRIIQLLQESPKPVNGDQLADTLKVSRQAVVQDIALLRANGTGIMSTNRGYTMEKHSGEASRVFKVIHTDEQVEEELNLFVDMGGRVIDVFVYHKAYGVVRAALNLKSRKDVKNYMQELHSGTSSFLKNVTGGYHYHTVTADNESDLDAIQEELQKKGFLANLLDYEPVDFWKDK